LTGVLLMAYGGPESLDEVEPYLADVRGGRPSSPELVAEVRERYRLIGGGSPLLRWTRRVADALQERLDPAAYRVRVGMRHWHPYIADAVRESIGGGERRLLAVPMSPYYARMSVGAYADKLTRAIDGADVEVRMARDWHLHPALLDAFAERIAARFLGDPAVLFTAHSLPRRILDEGDPYPDQLRETARALAERLGLPRWSFAFQSPGRTGEAWLGPFAEEALDALAAAGERSVLVVPIGFLCDHVEILYDVDVALKQRADRLGLRLERTESLNDSPALIGALQSVVGALEAGGGEGVSLL